MDVMRSHMSAPLRPLSRPFFLDHYHSTVYQSTDIYLETDPKHVHILSVLPHDNDLLCLKNNN